MKSEARMRTRNATREAGRKLVALLFVGVALVLSQTEALAAKTVKVKAVITAAAEVNPDYKGRASPVNIIVFQLTSADTFMNEDFFSLFDAEAGVLGGDVLDRTQILLQPGEVREWNTEFSKETRFVGVIAAYRDIENAQWRSSMELPKRGFIGRMFRDNKLQITVDTLAVTVALK
jgi:type VI secretion system protein VasD